MLELNNLPVSPECFEIELVDNLLESRPDLLDISQMTQAERCFVNGLVRLYKPKRILEIGVNMGGGTCVILNAIHDMQETTVTSIDIAEFVDYSGKQHRVGAAVAPNDQWTLITGKDPVEVIEDLDGPFDFLVLDTAHVHPVESLNFLTAFPFLTPNAIMILHDIDLFAIGPSPDVFPHITFACKLLFDTITAKKRRLSDGLIECERSNIGALQLLSYTKEHIEDVFSMLSFPWGIIPSNLDKFESFFSKYYSNKATGYFKLVSEFEQSVYWGSVGYLIKPISEDRIKNILFRLEEILQKERFIFYGAGSAAEKLLKYFKENNIRLPDEIWDINASQKKESDIPVVLPNFQRLNNDDYGMLITITYPNTIKEIIEKCNDVKFYKNINICALLVFDKLIKNENVTPTEICGEINISVVDVVAAEKADIKYISLKETEQKSFLTV